MYYVSKRMEIAGAHNLKLSYESKCANIHGHNWIVTVFCKAKELTEQIPECYKASVQESEGNIAIYERDED